MRIVIIYLKTSVTFWQHNLLRMSGWGGGGGGPLKDLPAAVNSSRGGDIPLPSLLAASASHPETSQFIWAPLICSMTFFLLSTNWFTNWGATEPTRAHSSPSSPVSAELAMFHFRPLVRPYFCNTCSMQESASH